MTREEALKKVRQMSLPKETMEILEALVPELAESEDERIRRWLCDYFSSIDKAWIHKDITCIDILRWLEKQKEQNLIMANSPQLKEQKQEKFPPYVTGFKGHPDPAGTSDLEEAAKEYASKTLCDPDDGPSTGLAKESFIAGAEWQKEQKPAEWSEEDEKDMAHIIRILDDCYVYGTHDLSKTDHENLVNKLKSLRPSWKPSEEQMEELNKVRTLNPGLDALYQQLKNM